MTATTAAGTATTATTRGTPGSVREEHPAQRPGARGETVGQRRGRRTVWAAGLLVALGAGIATAHGLYEVATAAGVPRGIAWLYPAITDGLALVAYGATARLRTRPGQRYAWAVVLLAAGLSGLAQAAHLAGGLQTAPDVPVGVDGGVPAALRFGVGAWPAAAAAVAAHLLHLLGTDPDPEPPTESYDRPYARSYDAAGPYGEGAAEASGDPGAGPAARTTGTARTPDGPAVQRPLYTGPARPSDPYAGLDGPSDAAAGHAADEYDDAAWWPTKPPARRPAPAAPDTPATGSVSGRTPRTSGAYDPASDPDGGVVGYRRSTEPAAVDDPAQPADRAADGRSYTEPDAPYEDPRPAVLPSPPPPAGGAGERARAAARSHRERHGALPTVSGLMALAQVARGTAGEALKDLREEHPARPALQIVPAPTTTTRRTEP